MGSPVKVAAKADAGKGAAAESTQGGGGSSASASSQDRDHHEVGSGVKATAASLAHAAEHLKEATSMLEKKAAAGKGANGASATTSATSASSSAAGDSNGTAVANGTVAVKKDTTPPRDLLAYSKEQKHPGDTIHVLFTSNGEADVAPE